ncbi:sensor histidine kinase [Streptomyces beihaiensis]|uniref:histidine kinase n=1 Tax=Streptomyces beihaiensis TaxID=2984495 RepID=A0ABT3TWA5_9ACTN|nr:histidine kinase [Streptomyces beihaiensis]MCX3061329.1 histidine kinase [Streptomyces beihaiensis]
MTTTGEAHRTTAGGPWWWERWRSALFDLVLAALSAAECAVEGIPFAHKAGLPVPVGVVFGVLAGASLLLRRRWPIAVVLVSVAITPASMGVMLTVVGLYSLAASEMPRRIIGALAGMSFVGALIVGVVRAQQQGGSHPDTVQVAGWVVPLVAVTAAVGLTAPPLLLGLYVGARRRLMESLRERNESLERELSLLAERAEERAEWARGEERTRIAREMHDVVAHRVSLMVVHAAALQAVARKDPEKAVRNAALVGDMGRQALTELREMLGVLRSGKSAAGRGVPLAAVGEAAAAAASRVEPGARSGSVPESGAGRESGAVGAAGADGGPCLAELDALVEQSRAAGMVVEVLVEGEARTYAAVVEQTAYRVVQEALTNVHKHAAGAKAYVRLAHRGAEVAMQVENEAPPVPGAAAEVGLPSGGNGLVGMRERVAGLGGVFVSGPTEGGGFRVSAVLPAG